MIMAFHAESGTFPWNYPFGLQYLAAENFL